MNEEKEIKIELMEEWLCQMRICCNLSPDEMKRRKDEVDAKLPYTGLASRWEINMKDYPPCKCNTNEGCWHYVAEC